MVMFTKKSNIEKQKEEREKELEDATNQFLTYLCWFVELLMHPQLSPAYKSFVAFITEVGKFFQMSLHVDVKIIL